MRLRLFRLNRRVLLAVALNATLLAVIGSTFWQLDWQYSLPTPRPDGFYQPPLGAHLALASSLRASRPGMRPLVINFANPHCPCTEFNLDHLRKLQKQFGAKVDFLTVLE